MSFASDVHYQRVDLISAEEVEDLTSQGWKLVELFDCGDWGWERVMVIMSREQYEDYTREQKQ